MEENEECGSSESQGQAPQEAAVVFRGWVIEAAGDQAEASWLGRIRRNNRGFL